MNQRDVLIVEELKSNKTTEDSIGFISCKNVVLTAF